MDTSLAAILIEKEAERYATKYNKDFLDIKDLQELMGLGRENITALIQREDFPSIQQNRRWIVGIMEFVVWRMREGGILK
ncbi:MAG: hypothetical protein LBM01_04060 [Christensenellaceae bacterium]|jgi:hypothetical protein|nr:hypothetical protein [Christensenellaceae bacterium]